MEKLLISVIMPTYNAEEDIEESIQILLEQTYKNIEILVVDDGSTDATGAICDEMAQKDSRVRVFHKENGGCSSARNLGLREAKGDYVMFLDPDDWLDNDTFEELVPLIEKDDLDVVRFNYIRELRSRSEPRKNTLLPETVCRGEECRKLSRQALGLVGPELEEPANMRFLTSACMSLYRKRLIDDNGLEFYDVRKIGDFSDGLFNVRFLLHADRFLFVDRGFFHFCRFNKNAMSSRYIEDYPEKQQLLFEMLKDIAQQQEDPAFLEAYYNRVVFSVLDLCMNALRGPQKEGEKRKELKRIVKAPAVREAFDWVYLGNFPSEWKLYFNLAKHGLIRPLYSMTKNILSYQK